MDPPQLGRKNLSLEFIASIGSLLSLMGIFVDIFGRFAHGLSKNVLAPIDRALIFRKCTDPLENLRQHFLLIGAVILTLFYVLEGSPLYIALEVLLTISALVWYFPVHPNLETSEKLKAWAPGPLAVGIAFGLYLAGSVCGFHWWGILGIEALGASFVISSPKLLRDGLGWFGGLCLVIYASLGLVYGDEDKSTGFLVSLCLNTAWTICNFVLVVHSKRAG